MRVNAIGYQDNIYYAAHVVNDTMFRLRMHQAMRAEYARIVNGQSHAGNPDAGAITNPKSMGDIWAKISETGELLSMRQSVRRAAGGDLTREELIYILARM